MKESNEQILVNRLLQKEEAAWKELFEVHSGSLAYVCSRYIIDRDSVNDVLQNSFIQMFRSIDSFEFRGNGSLKAWITRIAVNESLKHIKQNVDFKIIADDSEIPDVQHEDEPDLEEISQQEIMNMIHMLPDGYRTVFNLFVFEEKSHREIAEILGIAENSSASQFHRAKSMLARKIKEHKISKTAQYE
ncbi:RNA polymerase sigma-70 factor, ECF subfamily [Chryseobacterium taichungense]|uniref:RNA polymerase sigma-70 factor, ECF subfamily n=1 Tax=Chryseobacterium taichungense TaxID=295069 RepID=A0A1H8AST3_9FLAO|nr:RNA polymerase sigma factor [Chryseobacterium taichungense]SEM73770.1 RNA polymerase sigma-70 factor, ECF subfamily [Chryseobacterium taichungense]